MQQSNEQDPQRIARQAVLNGQMIPATVAGQLEARGIDVGALEERLLQNQEWKQ